MAATREQVVQAAEKYVARGKIEPAIREYRKLLADNPNDINTLNRIGDLYARIQRIDEAVDFFMQIAEQYSAEGFFVKAIAIYKKIIKLDPTRLEVYEALAELYHKQGLVTEARTQYQVLADYYVKHQNAASAIAIYQKMVQLEPENPTYHVKLAEIYHQQQLIEKAMWEYRIIAELMIQHGRPHEAAQVYERALNIDSQNLGFIEDAVRKLREADYAEGATRLLTVAVERNPQANQVARKIEDEDSRPPMPQAAVTQELEIEAEPEAEILAEPEMSPSFGAILEEDELSFSLDEGDDLSRAMAEAAAAVGGAPAPRVADPESEEIELDLDDVFEVDLAAEEEEQPASLVKPPADMLGAPARPAWSQEATPVPGAAFAAPPAAPIEEPVEEIELELDLELDDPFAGMGAVEPQAEQTETIAEPAFDSGWTSEPPPWLMQTETEETWQTAEVEAPVAWAAEPEAEEDLDLVTEAEVLAKYGLEDKALERLGEALQLRPDHLQAMALLIQIHLDKGREAEVIELANQMSAIAARKANREPWQKVQNKLLDAGYRLDGDQVLSASHVPAAPFAPQVAPPAATPVAPPAARPAGKPSSKTDDLLRDILGSPTPRTPRTPPPAAPTPVIPAPLPEPVAPEPVFSEPAFDESLFSEPLFEEPVFEEPPLFDEPVPFAAPPAASPPPPAPSRSIFDPLQIGQLVESEAEDWSALDVPVPVPPPPAQSVAPESPAMLDDTGSMSWLDEADRHREEKQGGPAGLFDEEDDFFDLAGELVEELSKEEVFQRDGVTIQSEQSLEEIVEGFKKGVAEHLSPTDYDTHFNLGIAYREMGLLDEAIGEFQLAAKDPSHLVLCCSMLGLCFLDKGLPELAVKWYRRALEAPGIHEEDQLGMLYDLGNVYMMTGDNMSAYNTFAELYGVNANYRDVVAKLEELGSR